MDMFELLEAVKSNLERLQQISQYYPPNTDICYYSERDRFEIRCLQGSLEMHGDALREIADASRAHYQAREGMDENAP
jgi:hypothetical protein